ncbi:hypothetical protein [Porphyrobacter sp. CACIAM 03H1]|uniref:hypothetical protein n=1 Tax=Porphyrobacter sp. CACIAM 03H1 TaxID=2003315 RepID=UPI000B5A3F40|nr:hypothetical protein [Porphyrobacter sp. CACIAM 03H1]ASJ91243.1 hypothetical protein CBR61_10180 [Porphyrobacter sp. CACIAM 03H1]
MIGTLRSVAFVLAAPFAVMACGPESTTISVDLPSTIDFSDGFQQADADAIRRKCGATDVELEVRPDGEIRFEPSPYADYEASACVLRYIKQSGATKFGFVGNEKYQADE